MTLAASVFETAKPLDAAVVLGLLSAIRRATLTIREETAALKANALLDHGEFRRRKDLCLLDLTRRGIAPGEAALHPDVIAALRELKNEVIENQRSLRVHLTAARAVTEILMRAIADEESDRTYTNLETRRAYRA